MRVVRRRSEAFSRSIDASTAMLTLRTNHCCLPVFAPYKRTVDEEVPGRMRLLHTCCGHP